MWETNNDGYLLSGEWEDGGKGGRESFHCKPFHIKKTFRHMNVLTILKVK